MVDQSKRGGQKQGARTGKQKQHQGVRPDSTTQDKAARRQQEQRRAGKQAGGKRA